jgi:predicted dinucleotide-binding enzyme
MRTNPKICIIGGGNIGMALAVELCRNIEEARLVMLTSKSEIFSKKLISIDAVTHIETICELYLVTNNYDEALKDIDMVFITSPAFCVADIIKKMILSSKTIICFVPGTGGREFYSKELIDQGHIVLGMDRAPFVARIINEGMSVVVSKKNQIRFAVMRSKNQSDIAHFLSKMLNMVCLPLNNYLAVTLTPSNQILHTTRLYAIFLDRELNSLFDTQIKFYAEWDDFSSSCLLLADNELQEVCRRYKPMNLSEVVSLKTHYESNTVIEMTKKIRNIKSLAEIDAPLLFDNGKYIIDQKSRYFIEDFPFGLCIIKGFSDIVGVNTPTIDKILNWFEKFFHVTYFTRNNFNGVDLKNIPIPQNFGINSFNDVMDYYAISMVKDT